MFLSQALRDGIDAWLVSILKLNGSVSVGSCFLSLGLRAPDILLPRAFPQSLFGRLLILKCQDLTRVETERGFPLRTKACVVLSVSDVALIKFAHYPDIRLLFLPR